MAQSAERIVKLLAQSGGDGCQAVADLAAEEPWRLTDLVVVAARQMAASSTHIDAAFGLVPDADLQVVADECVDSLRSGADPSVSQAASLVALLGLQAPETLRPHLDALWDIHPNEESLSAEWPWRGAEPGEDMERIAAHLAGPDPTIRRRAWVCLLESRTDEGWTTALEAIGGAVPDDLWANGSLLFVGIDPDCHPIRTLFSGPVSHVVFPDGFLKLQTTGVDCGLADPSWHPQGPISGRGRFGGDIDVPCKVCGRPLHRLVALDERPVAVLGPLELVTCLSCLGWSEGVLFFAHSGAEVRPAGEDVPHQEPEFPADPLPTSEVTLVASPPRWRLQDWGASNDRENLNRLGGEPTWIQSPWHPSCPECNRSMPFLFQLDSLDITGGPWWLWGSGGLLYAFWCDSCSISATMGSARRSQARWPTVARRPPVRTRRLRTRPRC